MRKLVFILFTLLFATALFATDPPKWAEYEEVTK